MKTPYQKYIISSSLAGLSLFFSSSLFALSCPSVEEIKNGQFQGWIAYSYGGERLSKKELKLFKTQVQRFNLSQWDDDMPEGPAHCYYVNKRNSYLAHPNFALWPEGNYWRWKKPDRSAQCEHSSTACIFKFTLD